MKISFEIKEESEMTDLEYDHMTCGVSIPKGPQHDSMYLYTQLDDEMLYFLLPKSEFKIDKEFASELVKALTEFINSEL